MTESVRAAHQAFRKARFFPALDGLRALSILAVIWHHAGGEGAPGALSRGFHGVSLFFAISGFLITTLLLREQDAHGQISLSKFYLRRTLRIFPLYYVVLGLYVALVLLVDRHSAAGAGFFSNLPYFLTYTSNWFVERDAGARVIFYFAWSLATEEQFYLVWPSVVRFARRWWAPAAVMAVLLTAHLAGVWAVSAGVVSGASLPMRILSSVATPICLGCLAAYLTHRQRGFAVAWRIAGHRASAPLAFAVMVAALSLDGVPDLLIAVSMTWLVVAVCVRADHWLMPPLANAPMRHIGTVSYGMYLMHMLAMNVVSRAIPGAGGLVRFLGASVLVVGMASASYYLFEKRILEWKERLMGRGKPADPEPATPTVTATTAQVSARLP
ncbi:MAG: acyltransferase [Myxococcales bacterium]